MKRHLLATLVLCGFLVSANPAWSLTINSGAIDVGDKDVVYASALVNSKYMDELAWLQLVLGEDYGFAEGSKYDVNMSDWTAIDGMSGSWAMELKDEPTNFFLKIGTGSLPAGTNDHYLFTNTGELGWAVIQLSDINIANVADVTRISHLGEIGVTPVTPVPEPATMLLLGLGLVGLAGAGRKFNSK